MQRKVAPVLGLASRFRCILPFVHSRTVDAHIPLTQSSRALVELSQCLGVSTLCSGAAARLALCVCCHGCQVVSRLRSGRVLEQYGFQKGNAW